MSEGHTRHARAGAGRVFNQTGSQLHAMTILLFERAPVDRDELRRKQ
jgi:hypothetical protein